MSEKFVDPVVADVHAIRAAMLEAAGGEIAELMRRVAGHQQSSHRRIIREPLRQRTGPLQESKPGRSQVGQAPRA
jgi:hypothetical protein